MKKTLIEIKEDELELTVPAEKLEFENVDFKYDSKKKELTLVSNGKKDDVSPYVISRGLVNAVNAAIITGRPLLLKGEPGCGKTKLAKAVAACFYKDALAENYFEWHVKSSSNARDGAYIFDHVNRLRDTTVNDPAAKNPHKYIRLGPMGLAFVTSKSRKSIPILLIDEIDKGDIDFPNDLLLELDEMRFKINELDQKENFIEADKELRPLVFITSNDERELPPAFLRRCLYYKIPPFGNDMLEKIAKIKLNSFYKNYTQEGETVTKLTDKQVEAIVGKFLNIKNNVTNVKPPSTSELLDWLRMILYKVNKKNEKVEDIISDPNLQKLTLKLLD